MLQALPRGNPGRAWKGFPSATSNKVFVATWKVYLRYIRQSTRMLYGLKTAGSEAGTNQPNTPAASHTLTQVTQQKCIKAQRKLKEHKCKVSSWRAEWFAHSSLPTREERKTICYHWNKRSQRILPTRMLEQNWSMARSNQLIYSHLNSVMSIRRLVWAKQ